MSADRYSLYVKNDKEDLVDEVVASHSLLADVRIVITNYSKDQKVLNKEIAGKIITLTGCSASKKLSGFGKYLKDRRKVCTIIPIHCIK
jgi:hypothetical protein